METHGTALLTPEIPAGRAITAIVPRVEVTGALQDPAPQLFLDLEHGEERSSIAISWTHDELERLLDSASGDDIFFTFDSDELLAAFDDVEAHGLRERALVFTVAVAGALGSGATIANAAPIIDRGGDGAASVTAVQSLAADSIATTGGASNARTPGLQIGDEATKASGAASVQVAKADGGIASNVHTPGLQTGDETSAAPTLSVKVAADTGLASNVHTPGVQIGDESSTAPAAASVKVAADTGLASNVHTPGLQTGDEASTAPAAASVKVAADTGLASNVHTPGLQTGDETGVASTPAVHVSAGGSDSEFLGIDSRDVTNALIAGGILLAIAGAGFAGTRRTGTARPA
jgi:hypothetical protein